MSYPSVAVVILNWNGKKYLEQFLPFLLKSTYPNLQLVVADNGSTDDSVEFLKKNYPGIRILSSPVNEGFAKGYNTALKQVESDFYVLLNSDVEVTPGWIEPVIQLMRRNPLVAASQPKMLSLKQRNYFEYAGAAGGWLDKYGYPFSRGRVFDVCEEDKGQYDSAEMIFWASGAAMFVRADVYREMGGFDDFFFAHQEEIDLCWRMQLAGYLIYACPGSVVYHLGGGTLPKGNSQKTFLNYRNNLVMLCKNLQWKERLWKIPYRAGLDAISAWKNLFTGDAGYFLAVLRAHLAWVKWVLTKRKQGHFPVKRVAPPHAVYNGNIVWEYFVRNKRRFSEIVDGKK